MEILAKALHPDAVLPKYANEGDAGCDLVAIEDVVLKAGGGRAMVGTGVAIAIPSGHGGFVQRRVPAKDIAGAPHWPLLAHPARTSRVPRRSSRVRPRRARGSLRWTGGL